MIEIDTIGAVSNATVAVGLADRESKKPLIVEKGINAIAGSGFFIDGQGVVMSAAHIFQSCITTAQSFEGAIPGVFTSFVADSKLEYNFYEIQKALEIVPNLHVDSYCGPTELDIGVARLRDIDYQHTLQIKEPSPSQAT